MKTIKSRKICAPVGSGPKCTRYPHTRMYGTQGAEAVSRVLSRVPLCPPGTARLLLCLEFYSKYPLFLGKKQKEFLVSVLYSDSRVSNPVPLAGRQGPECEGVSPGAHAALRGALPSQRGHELLLTRGSSSFSVGGALLDRGGEWGRSRGTDIF